MARKRNSDPLSTLSPLVVDYLQSLLNSSPTTRSSGRSKGAAAVAAARTELDTTLATLTEQEQLPSEVVGFLIQGLRQVETRLRQALPAPPPAAQATVSQSKWGQSRRKRIGIAGLKPDQENEVREECDGLAELRFLSQKTRKFPLVDHLVLATKWVGHPLDEAALANFDRQQVHRCHTGIKRLTDLVKQLARS